MGQPRPVLAVHQRGDSGTQQTADRSTTASTVAAWHRANSYLESYGNSSFAPLDLQHSRHSEAAAIDPEQQPLLRSKTTTSSADRENDSGNEGSTLTQTILNTTNSLLGVGLLSLPLAFAYAGWLLGLLLLTLLALLTSYTATLLARCLARDTTCHSYIDIAMKAYGPHGRRITILLFSLTTVVACVALVVLFAESMHALLENISVLHWKIICGAILLPLHFAPFRVLSMVSVLGIGACMGTVLLVVLAGLTTSPDGDGSLLSPAATSLLPQDWSKVPLSIGLLMSPWTAHAILPNLYRDMSSPHQFGKATRTAFGGAYVVDVAIASAGYLMYGCGVGDAITGNVIRTTDSLGLAIALTVLVALMPVGKVPLTARPLIVLAETMLNLLEPSASVTPSQQHALRCLIRVLWIVCLITGAIFAPDFRLVMAFMGSALCVGIAVVLPLLFYLKIFVKELRGWKKAVLGSLVVVSCAAGAVGTCWAFSGQS